jgi:hypothetical protein
MFIHTLFYLFELSSLGVLLKLSESNWSAKEEKALSEACYDE